MELVVKTVVKFLVMKSSTSSIHLTDNKTDAIYEEPDDPRAWTAQHYEAYGNVSSECELMNKIIRNGVDAIRPGGFTPLMVASAFRGAAPCCGGMKPKIMNAISSANIITDLLCQGACIDRATEKTEETSLHLAARYSCVDAASRLLDSGANRNATDSTGRTPLHTAIAANARGVFDLLFQSRSTNLDARTLDGTTPLILAARPAMGKLSDLLDAMLM